MKILKKKLPLEYVLKNIPAKFGDDPTILRHRKLGMMILTETFFHWLILGPICLKRTQIFLGRSKKITDGSGVP